MYIIILFLWQGASEVFSTRPGSGDIGKYKGDDGNIRNLKFLEPVTVPTLLSYRGTQPFEK